MHWGNDKQKELYVKFLLDQYAFLKNLGVTCPYLPACLDVDISNRCNLRCISCFQSIPKFKSMPDMTMDTFMRIMDQAQGRVSRITIGNHGEPLLHKDVFSMLKEVKKRGFFLNLINNGTLLTKERAQQLLDIGVDRLVFSLDSVDPVQYARIRKNARLSVTLKNVLYFLKINYEAGMKTYVNISTVDTQQALSSNVDIFDYFSKLPVQIVYTSPMLNFHDMLEIRDQTKFHAERFKEIADSKKLPVCINGFDRLLIRPNGNASLCGIDWDSVHILGNINQEDYSALWNNPKAQEFRRAILDRDYSKIEHNGILCSRCDSKWGCSVESQMSFILKSFSEDLEDGKVKLDTKVGTPERYDNLLRELERVEQEAVK